MKIQGDFGFIFSLNFLTEKHARFICTSTSMPKDFSNKKNLVPFNHSDLASWHTKVQTPEIIPNLICSINQIVVREKRNMCSLLRSHTDDGNHFAWFNVSVHPIQPKLMNRQMLLRPWSNQLKSILSQWFFHWTERYMFVYKFTTKWTKWKSMQMSERLARVMALLQY